MIAAKCRNNRARGRGRGACSDLRSTCGPIGAQTWHTILGPALVKLTCETTRQRFSLAVGATRLEFLA